MNDWVQGSEIRELWANIRVESFISGILSLPSFRKSADCLLSGTWCTQCMASSWSAALQRTAVSLRLFCGTSPKAICGPRATQPSTGASRPPRSSSTAFEIPTSRSCSSARWRGWVANPVYCMLRSTFHMSRKRFKPVEITKTAWFGTKLGKLKYYSLSQGMYYKILAPAEKTWFLPRGHFTIDAIRKQQDLPRRKLYM